jgi:hypothetical protein
MSSQPALVAVARMVSSRSSSSSEPSRAKRRSRPESDLDVSRAELERIVVVLVLALVPDLDRRLVAPLVLADANALRVVAVGAERAGAAGADHLVAALVALLLFLEALLQGLHQLVPAHLLDRGLFLRRELELELLLQPFERNVLREVGQHLDALEVGGERAVELVEQGLVLDQRGAGQVVETVDGGAFLVVDDARLDRFEQGQVFLHRDLELGGAECEKEIDQHGSSAGEFVRIARCPGARPAGGRAFPAPAAAQVPACCFSQPKNSPYQSFALRG